MLRQHCNATVEVPAASQPGRARQLLPEGVSHPPLQCHALVQLPKRPQPPRTQVRLKFRLSYWVHVGIYACLYTNPPPPWGGIFFPSLPFVWLSLGGMMANLCKMINLSFQVQRLTASGIMVEAHKGGSDTGNGRTVSLILSFSCTGILLQSSTFAGRPSSSV